MHSLCIHHAFIIDSSRDLATGAAAGQVPALSGFDATACKFMASVAVFERKN
jgi:hypothetical protein